MPQREVKKLMTKNDIKIELIKWLSEVDDEALLIKLKAAKDDIIYTEESKSKIIGYRPNNSPVIKSDFLAIVQQAENQINSGEFSTLEQLEIEIENW